MAATEKSGRKPKPVVQYYVDGHPQNFYGNKLSSIAYFHTAGISRKAQEPGQSGVERLTSKDFVALLNKGGAEDPRAKAFKVELPNGKVISAKIGKLEVAVPKGATRKAAAKPRATQKQAQPTRRAPAKPKAITSEVRKAAMDERKALKAWKDGGEKGTRPSTKNFDAVTAASVAGAATKGAKKAAAVHGVTPTNVGKGAKRPAKTAAAKTTV